MNRYRIIILPAVISVLIMAGCRKHGDAVVAVDQKQAAESVLYNASWPVYRFNQALTGSLDVQVPETPSLLWTFQSQGPVTATAVIMDSIVYIGSDDMNFYALDLKTGESVWHFKTEGSIEGAACILGEGVFFGSSDTFVYALNRTTGELLWKFKSGAKVLGAINYFRHSKAGKSFIVFGSYDSKMYAVDADTGILNWSYQAESYINGAPAVDAGRVVFGSCDANLYVLSAETGSLQKRIDTGSYIAGSCAVVGDFVYAGNYGDLFLKADIQAGQVAWEFSKTQAPFFSSPAVTNRYAVVGCRDNRLYCLDADTGDEKWSFTALNAIDSSPIICKETVIVGSDDGRVYMLNLKNGNKQWSYQIAQPIQSSPAVAEGVIVIGCEDGSVYAFGDKR